jgi:uncharacterized repeat protein (TIGR01451 family)
MFHDRDLHLFKIVCVVLGLTGLGFLVGRSFIAPQWAASGASPGKLIFDSPVPTSTPMPTPTPTPLPDLRLVKTGYPVVLTDDELLYTLRCESIGGSTANDVTVEDTLPAGLPLVGASPPPHTVTLPSLEWAVGDLSPGQIWEAMITITAPASASVITNAALAAAQPDVMTQTLFATQVVTSARILRVTKAGSTLVVDVGDELVYTLYYWNDGNQSAAEVVLTDTFPSDVTMTAVLDWPTDLTSERGVWSLGTLEPDESGQVVITVTVEGDGDRMLLNVVDVTCLPEPGCVPGHAELFTRVRPRPQCLPLVLRAFPERPTVFLPLMLRNA